MMRWHTQDTWQLWLRRAGLVLLALLLPWALSHQPVARGGAAVAHAAPAVLDDEPPETVCGLPVVPLESVIDPTFGRGGYLTLSWPTEDVQQISVARGENGSYIVAGFRYLQTKKPILSLVRYSDSGQRDLNFGTDGTVDITPPGDTEFNVEYPVVVRVQHSGILVGTNATGHVLLMRIDEAGVLDSSFGFNGYVYDRRSALRSTLVDVAVTSRDDVIIVNTIYGRVNTPDTQNIGVLAQGEQELLQYDRHGMLVHEDNLTLRARSLGFIAATSHNVAAIGPNTLAVGGMYVYNQSWSWVVTLFREGSVAIDDATNRTYILHYPNENLFLSAIPDASFAGVVMAGWSLPRGESIPAPIDLVLSSQLNRIRAVIVPGAEQTSTGDWNVLWYSATLDRCSLAGTSLLVFPSSPERVSILGRVRAVRPVQGDGAAAPASRNSDQYLVLATIGTSSAGITAIAQREVVVSFTSPMVTSRTSITQVEKAPSLVAIIQRPQQHEDDRGVSVFILQLN